MLAMKPLRYLKVTIHYFLYSNVFIAILIASTPFQSFISSIAASSDIFPNTATAMPKGTYAYYTPEGGIVYYYQPSGDLKNETTASHQDGSFSYAQEQAKVSGHWVYRTS